jgi:hypothetical protein
VTWRSLESILLGSATVTTPVFWSILKPPAELSVLSEYVAASVESTETAMPTGVLTCAPSAMALAAPSVSSGVERSPNTVATIVAPKDITSPLKTNSGRAGDRSQAAQNSGFNIFFSAVKST